MGKKIIRQRTGITKEVEPGCWKRERGEKKERIDDEDEKEKDQRRQGKGIAHTYSHT
jgi:hypothetical protein